MKKYVIPFLALVFVGCKQNDDDVTQPKDTNDQELITTVTLSFHDTLSNSTITATFKDDDGPGGNAPSQFDTIRLNQGTSYAATISFLDESESDDPENITAEIRDEDDEHIICYSSEAHVDIERTDTDGLYVVGLSSNWQTHAMAGLGTVTVTLKHQPGTKDGTCDPGETDVEIAFPVIVE